MSVETGERFLDDGFKLEHFCEEFLVVCPRCEKMARVLPNEKEIAKMSKKKIEQTRNRLFGPRKLVCSNCGSTREWSEHQIKVGADCDFYFRLPVWLRAACCGETLWAYNREHLEMLERFVGAKLRERTIKGRNSFLSKLPQWIKSAKNRDEILKAIERMRQKI